MNPPVPSGLESVSEPRRAEGLLFSQIGYDAGGPVRVIIRGAKRGRVPDGATFLERRGGRVAERRWRYWGEKWESHWWIAECERVAGEVEFMCGVEGFPECVRFRVGEALLWEETWRWVGKHQFDKRRLILVDQVGWQDCGVPWKEFTSHAAAVIGLVECLRARGEALPAEERSWMLEHIRHGAAYLALCQDQAEERGLPAGSAVHEHVLFPAAYPSDLAKGAQALAGAAWAEEWVAKGGGAKWAARGAAMLKAFRACEDYPVLGFWPAAHGAATGATPPRERMTRDLLNEAMACLWLTNAGECDRTEEAAELVRKVAARQVRRTEAEDGLWGHFRTFDSKLWTEAAWIHQVWGCTDEPTRTFHDAGGLFPFYLFPVLELIRRRPDDSRRGEWERMLRDFVEGYLLPASARNPFGILPNRVLADGKLAEFSGSWHGMNAIYGYAAALGEALAAHFGDERLCELAANNRQWIAGLNAGLTAHAYEGAAKAMNASDVPPGEARPVSMIHGVGARYAGSWTNIRGSICNGFCSVGQFLKPEEFRSADDGPWFLSDEDWLPHGTAWLSGLAAAPVGVRNTSPA